MSSQSLARPRKRKKTGRRSAPGSAGWTTWWPLMVGIAITVVAVKTAEIVPLMGTSGLFKLQLLYPFPLLLKEPRLGLSESTADSWSQIMLYAQWVIYGLYASVAVWWTARSRAFMHIAVIHALGFAALWVLPSR